MISAIKRGWRFLFPPQPDPAHELLQQIRQSAIKGAKRIDLPKEDWDRLANWMDNSDRLWNSPRPDTFMIDGVEIVRRTT